MSEKNNNIKIFLSYHKPSTLLKNEIFTPIHVGRALQTKRSDFNNKWLTENLIGDDEGENISNKNPNFCELTAQYWAWKNLPKSIKYVGFMHYRRHLNFTNTKFPINMWGLNERKELDSDYIKYFGLNTENVKKVVSKYDIVTVEKWDVTNAGTKNNYDHYASSDPKLHIKDYDLALDILYKKYPEYKQSAETYNNSKYGYYTNIFVMRRDIFNKYCEWLFDILFEVEKQTDISNYDFQEARIYGYISEWLFGIFITHLQNTTNLKIKELQRTLVINTDIREPINICFASDNNYAKHMGIAIASILKNKESSDVINIYVLDGGIADKTKKEIASLSKIAPFNIEYIQIDKTKFNKMPMCGTKHLSQAAYYRLTIGSQLPTLDKVLYLDCDLVVNKSLYNLYSTDIHNYYISGVIDILVDENTSRLKLDKYVNSGVLLMNLELWRKKNIEAKFFKYIEDNSDKIVWHDQDVLNVVCQNGIEYLDQRWNTQITPYGGNKSEEYRAIGSNGYIIHFISDKKPWHGKYDKFNKYYYNYVKITPWKKDVLTYYKSVVKRIFSSFIKDIFSINNVEDRLPKKEVRLFGMRFKFVRKTELMLREINDLRCRIDKINNQLYKMQKGNKKSK